MPGITTEWGYPPTKRIISCVPALLAKLRDLNTAGVPAEEVNTFRSLLGEGAKVTCSEGDKQKEEKVANFRQAMQWLIGEAERTTARRCYEGLGEMKPEQL